MKRLDADKIFLAISSFLMAFAIAGIIFILTGCGGGGSLEADDKAKESFPSAVYLHDRVITDQKEIDATLTGWKDARTQEAARTYGRTSIPYVRVNTIDHWGFYCDESPTKWCAGLYTGIIYAPIYHRITFDHKPSEDELKGKARHTLMSSDQIYELTKVEAWKGLGRWYVGYIPEGQIGYPVIVHEIGHALNIDVD